MSRQSKADHRRAVLVLSRREEFAVGPQNTEMSAAIAARGLRVISHFGDICSVLGEQLPPPLGVERVQRRSWLSRLFGKRLLMPRTAEYLLRTAALIRWLRPARIVAVCEYPLAAAVLAGYPLDQLAYYPLEVPDPGPGLFNIPHRVVQSYGPRMKFVVIPGEHRAEYFTKTYGCRHPYVVYNSVSLARREAMSEPGLLRQDIAARLPREPFVFYQGALYSQTHGEVIVSALRRVGRRHPVVIACKSEMPTAVRFELNAAASEGSVVLLGEVPNHMLHAIRLRAALGLCLQNSQWCTISDACTPNKYFEYLSSGVPVVCSPNPAMRMWNERYGTGVCVEAVSPGALADAIGGLMAAAGRRRVMSERCLEAFERTLNYEAQAAAFLDDFLRGIPASSQPVDGGRKRA